MFYLWQFAGMTSNATTGPLSITPAKRKEVQTLMTQRAEIQLSITQIYARVTKRSKMHKDGVLTGSQDPGERFPSQLFA